VVAQYLVGFVAGHIEVTVRAEGKTPGLFTSILDTYAGVNAKVGTGKRSNPRSALTSVASRSIVVAEGERSRPKRDTQDLQHVFRGLGQRPGHRASVLFPDPGTPTIRALWPIPCALASTGWFARGRPLGETTHLHQIPRSVRYVLVGFPSGNLRTRRPRRRTSYTEV
jgi:hypothetical protein